MLASASAEDPVGGRRTPTLAFAPVFAAAVHKSAATSGVLHGPSPFFLSSRIEEFETATLLASASAEDPVGGRHARAFAFAFARAFAAAVHKSAATSGVLHGASPWLFLSSRIEGFKPRRCSRAQARRVLWAGATAE